MITYRLYAYKNVASQLLEANKKTKQASQITNQATVKNLIVEVGYVSFSCFKASLTFCLIRP